MCAASKYANYLCRVLPRAAVRLRTTTANQPVVITVDGKAAGVLMLVNQ